MKHSDLISTEHAAELLRAGQVVAVPTETVYGLAAAINQPAALTRVFALKQRPANHPLIVHLAEAAELSNYAHPIPDCAWTLATHFWPGPLTLVLPKTTRVPDAVTGGQTSVAVRVPAHPTMRELIRRTGAPLAAPSANPFGALSPTRAAHVQRYFNRQVPIVDGGPCSVGLESTIVQVNQDGTLRLLRPGCVTPAQIEAVLQPSASRWCEGSHNLRTPGNLHQHYAPTKPLFVMDNPEALASIRNVLPGSLVVMGEARWQSLAEAFLLMPPAADAYAQTLYANLQQADLGPHTAIVVQRPPIGAAWLAIHDRLAKAAYATQQRFPQLTTVL